MNTKSLQHTRRKPLAGQQLNLKMSNLFKHMHYFSVQYMTELDMQSNRRSVILKLPYKLREKWRVSACEILERDKGRAQFIDIVTFIEQQVKIVSDPIFGDIQTTPLPTGSKPVNITKSQPKPRFKGDSYATTVSAIETPAFLETTNFLKEKSAQGHKSKDFNKCLICKVCSQNHPSILHINQTVRASSTDTKQSKEPSVSSALVSLQRETKSYTPMHFWIQAVQPPSVQKP